jgi:photosystem II stability/assembly factor-like uncharacterized protein
MIKKRRKPVRVLVGGMCAAMIAAAGAAAAELKHDLYFCVNLSGQGQVMGSTAVHTASGLYRSSDRQNFEHVGFSHIRTFAATYDPREPSTLFVSVLDGVLRGKDRGKTWRRMTGWDMTEPKAIQFDPNAPDHIYAGLPDGIAVSLDRGVTWRRMNEGIRRGYTHSLEIDRTKAGRVLAGTELGIYLTENGARAWRRVLPTEKTVYDIRQSPHDPRAFLAVTSSDGAFRSADGGRTWRRIEGVPKEHTLHFGHFDAHDARRFVICGWDVGVLVSEDDGRTWSERSEGLPNRQIWCVSPDPDLPGRLYAAPYLKPLYVSDDFGRTWRPLAFEKAIVYNVMFAPRR